MIKPDKTLLRTALATTLWAMATTPATAETGAFLMPSFAPTSAIAEPIPPIGANRRGVLPAPGQLPNDYANATNQPANSVPGQGSVSPVAFSAPSDSAATSSQPPGGQLPPPADSSTMRDVITQETAAAAAQEGVIRFTQPAELAAPTDGYAAAAAADPQPVVVQGRTLQAPQASAQSIANPSFAVEDLPAGEKTGDTGGGVVYTPEATLIESCPEEEYGYGIFKPVHQFAGSCLHAGLFGGVEGVFLAPTGDVSQSVTFLDLLNDRSVTQDTEFGLGAGFRTWVGLRAGHSGFRASYFQLQNQYGRVDGVRELIKDDTFSSQYDIDASIFDFELFHEFCLNACGDSILYATLGARYAELERAALTVGAGNEGNVDLYGLAHGATALEGWGLTSALGGVHALRFGWLAAHHYPGYCPPQGCSSIDFPWAFVWEVRGAVLQAETRASALTEAQAFKADPSAISYSRDQAFGSWDGTVAMGSLQLGLQYSKHIHCCPSVLSFASGFEGQLWQMGDINVRSTSIAGLEGELSGVPFGGAVRSTAEASDEDLALVGFFVRVGLSY